MQLAFHLNRRKVLKPVHLFAQQQRMQMLLNYMQAMRPPLLQVPRLQWPRIANANCLGARFGFCPRRAVLWGLPGGILTH